MPASIRCGNARRFHRHATAADVRACYTEGRFDGEACVWLVDRGPHPEPDDIYSSRIIDECGAPTREILGGDGWECAAGHRHEGIEREHARYGPAWEREAREAFDRYGVRL